MNQKWEYLVVSQDTSNANEVSYILDQYGRDGWELVEVVVVSDSGDCLHYFKRALTGEDYLVSKR